jgi:hypothetical protein
VRQEFIAPCCLRWGGIVGRVMRALEGQCIRRLHLGWLVAGCRPCGRLEPVLPLSAATAGYEGCAKGCAWEAWALQSRPGHYPCGFGFFGLRQFDLRLCVAG